ncbi:MAG: cytochrome c3 family protein [Desulfobacterales bacterium]|nr:cytochrome c3 family protein [Desulfobacterales bacterium]
MASECFIIIKRRIIIGLSLTGCVSIFLISLFYQTVFSSDVLGNANSLKAYHSDAELSCNDCHTVENEVQNIPATDDCLECHGDMEAVAQLTADKDPNPHDSPHYGPYLDCDLCHHEHKISENYCGGCHEWVSSVP